MASLGVLGRPSTRPADAFDRRFLSLLPKVENQHITTLFLASHTWSHRMS